MRQIWSATLGPDATSQFGAFIKAYCSEWVAGSDVLQGIGETRTEKGLLEYAVDSAQYFAAFRETSFLTREHATARLETYFLAPPPYLAAWCSESTLASRKTR